MINGQEVPKYTMADQAGNFYVSAGLSARYVFSRHFEAVGDLAFNLGLRYRFNLRKPVAAVAP